MNLSSLISSLKEHSTYTNYEYTKLQNTAEKQTIIATVS